MSEKTNTTGALDIGAVLSAARMKRDLSIATAAMQSNLSQDIIERLEQNRFAEIGAPVFTRGYLGLYARFLGLNEAAVSQAFNKIKSEPAPELRLTAANAPTAVAATSAPGCCSSRSLPSAVSSSTSCLTTTPG